MYVSNQEDLEVLIQKINGAPLLAIDTEFHREKTYFAKLCLIQLATDEVSAIVDPLRVKDLTPLADILTDERTVKIFHAGSQDVEILINAVGVAPSPVFDTQIAAGLLGHPQQMGYGALVKALCDVSLAKADSFTDWARRPLSQAQLEYAINDVLYLPGIYRKMMDKLSKAGRFEWLEHDFDHLSDPKTYEVEPQEAWRRVKRVSSLTRKQLAVVRSVAAWREETARDRNVPRKWVLTDEVIVEIAKRSPSTKGQLLEVRGLGERLTDRSIKEILDGISASLATDPETWPKLRKRVGASHEVEGVVDLMVALLRLRAKEHGVTTQFLAGREELVKVAKGECDDLPVMTGWRKDIIGDELIQLLAGNISLGVRDGELQVVDSFERDATN